MMSNFNKVVLSLQKIKSKNFGLNQKNLVHYLVKDYGFSNDEAEIVDAVKANAIKSVIFNGKTSYRIVKTDNVSDVTVFPNTQVKTPDDITTEDAIILDETDAITTTRDTATNTISNEQEVDDVSALIERAFNDLIDDVFNKKPASLIVHVGTNDQTNDLLSSVKKIANKTNKTSPNTVLTFSSIIFRKDKNDLEKT